MKTQLHQCRSSTGFSLIELIVVIGIIGMLASFLLVNGDLNKRAARDAKRMDDLKQIAHIFELYKLENGKMPLCNSGFKIEPGFPVIPNGSGVLEETYSSSNPNHRCEEHPKITEFISEHFETVPSDPRGSDDDRYYYYYDSAHLCSNGSSFGLLYAQMEVQENSNEAEVCPANGTGTYSNDGNYKEFTGEINYPYAITLGAPVY